MKIQLLEGKAGEVRLDTSESGVFVVAGIRQEKESQILYFGKRTNSSFVEMYSAPIVAKDSMTIALFWFGDVVGFARGKTALDSAKNVAPTASVKVSGLGSPVSIAMAVKGAKALFEETFVFTATHFCVYHSFLRARSQRQALLG